MDDGISLQGIGVIYPISDSKLQNCSCCTFSDERYTRYWWTAVALAILQRGQSVQYFQTVSYFKSLAKQIVAVHAKCKEQTLHWPKTSGTLRVQKQCTGQ